MMTGNNNYQNKEKEHGFKSFIWSKIQFIFEHVWMTLVKASEYELNISNKLTNVIVMFSPQLSESLVCFTAIFFLSKA